MTIYIAFLVFAYLFGSISTAIIVSKLMRLPDPRQEGSKNPGATNVLRLGGKTAGIITLIGDAIKGFIPVFIASFYFAISGSGLAYIAFAAFLGHLFPIFFKFKGGKGVATLLGCLFALSWVLGVAAIITWLAIALITRYSSLAALITAAVIPFYSYFFANPTYFIPLAIMTLFLIARHHENIWRLAKGQENKIGAKKK